ncbi:MAG: zinc dependent phospholipase C family protein [Negativicutes bacterium]|nr:zinc dependent phospholipase C family protein [Negativicutes bacterium]
MPQPITHYLVVEEAMLKASPPLWKRYGNYAGFGSFGPDLFYVKDIFRRYLNPGLNWDEVSDIQHRDRSLDFFFAMLDAIKDGCEDASAEGDKLLTFAVGYYSHVITDCIIHPFVYRRSRDHWRYHQPAAGYRAHKRLEAMIDVDILAYKGREIPAPELFRVQCDDSLSKGLLDADLVWLLDCCLPLVYGASAGFRRHWTQSYPIDDPAHPVNAAYADFKKLVGVTYQAQNILYGLDAHWGNAGPLHRLSQADLEEANELRGPWLPQGPSATLTYSARDLFSLAVNAVQKMVAAVSDYWQSDTAAARDFFDGDGLLFLEQNWNFDTGLPAAVNDDPANLAIDDSRFDFGVDILAGNYNRCTAG